VRRLSHPHNQNTRNTTTMKNKMMIGKFGWNLTFKFTVCTRHWIIFHLNVSGEQQCRIWGSHGGRYEDGCILGCSAMLETSTRLQGATTQKTAIFESDNVCLSFNLAFENWVRRFHANRRAYGVVMWSKLRGCGRGLFKAAVTTFSCKEWSKIV
jgi:hypothetical protein